MDFMLRLISLMSDLYYLCRLSFGMTCSHSYVFMARFDIFSLLFYLDNDTIPILDRIS
jgi:hypothetical protein